jgi:hypothetical protein
MTFIDAPCWAAGFNNEDSLATIASDVPAFQGVPFTVFMVTPDPGIMHTDGDVHQVFTGFPIVHWRLSGLADVQFLYIQDKYTPGGTGYSADMTIRTLTGYPSGTATYANFNATLNLPKRSDLSPIINAYTDADLVFIIKAAL